MTRPTQPLKYYVYISDTKLDMLAAGIPTTLRDRIVADLALDLQVVKLSLRERPSEETRYSKLRLVTKYIDDKLGVDTVDEPRAYFRGSMSMRWGPYREVKGTSNELVFFGSETDRTIVGLGGSMAHVMGAVGASFAHTPMSSTPFMLRALRGDLGLDSPLGHTRPDEVEDTQARALREVVITARRMPGPAEPLEFLARKLLQGRSRQIFPRWCLELRSM